MKTSSVLIVLSILVAFFTISVHRLFYMFNNRSRLYYSCKLVPNDHVVIERYNEIDELADF